MEQEVRALLAEYVGEYLALLEEIESAWARQTCRPAERETRGRPVLDAEVEQRGQAPLPSRRHRQVTRPQDSVR